MGNLGVRLQCPTSVFIAGVELAMLEKLKTFANCESGAIAIEYGLIAVVNDLGTSLNAKFKSISTQLK